MYIIQGYVTVNYLILNWKASLSKSKSLFKTSLLNKLNLQIDQCSQVICVNEETKRKYYEKGEEVFSKISDLEFSNDKTNVFDVLEGTKCGYNSVCFTVF